MLTYRKKQKLEKLPIYFFLLTKVKLTDFKKYARLRQTGQKLERTSL